jgi:aminopeptidase N
VGAFSMNHLRFHGRDGAGYRLVGQVIRTLDSLNPMTSASLVGSFETWQRYDTDRQAAMRTELKSFLGLPAVSPNLFEPNLFEVAGKILAADGDARQSA